MSRNYDWSALEVYSDPVPGDPGVLTTQVAKYRTIADHIQNGATRLTAIVNDYSSQSEFVDAFAEQAEEVIGRIKKAEKKYTGFADAVESYIGPLRTARQDSYNLLMTARTLDDELAYAMKWQRHYEQEYRDADATEQPAIQKKIDRYADDAAEARTKLDSQYAQLQTVLATMHAAARAAADAIQETGDASGINDSAWVQFWEEHGSTIDTIMFWVGVVGAVLVVVALFIPGLNLIVAAIGIAIAIATVVIAACQVSAGTKSVQDALLEIALAVIPFGIGKLIKPAVTVAHEAASATLMASKAAQGIDGYTVDYAAAWLRSQANLAAPNALQKLLTGGADDLAQMNMLRNMALTVGGDAGSAAAKIDAQMWKFALEGSPLGDVFMPFAQEYLIDPIVDPIADAVLGDFFVPQPDSW